MKLTFDNNFWKKSLNVHTVKLLSNFFYQRFLVFSLFQVVSKVLAKGVGQTNLPKELVKGVSQRCWSKESAEGVCQRCQPKEATEGGDRRRRPKEATEGGSQSPFERPEKQKLSNVFI